MREAGVDPLSLAFCIVMTLAGSGIGLLSGLAPGIHVNTLSAVLLVVYPSLEGAVSGAVPAEDAATAVCCCVMSASVVHSFCDFVPSVFIGAPDDEALSLLPGHRLLLQGRGMAAVRAAAVGSVVGASVAIILSVPFQFLLSGGGTEVLDRFTPVVLAVAVFTILFGELRRGSLAWGASAFVLSGLLGCVCMDMEIPSDGVLGEGSLLFPLLTGLFGFPVLLESSSSGRIPPQRDDGDDPVGVVPGLKGVLTGCLAGWFPGITSTVGASISAELMPDRRPERFISTVASIGTVTSVLSLVTLSASGSGRSGTAVVIADIAGHSLDGVMSEAFCMLLLATAVASLMGYGLTIWSGKVMSRAVSGIRPDLLGRAVMVATYVLVLLLTGPWGLLVLSASTCVGLIPPAGGCGRIPLTGCLILPSLLRIGGYNYHTAMWSR